MKVVVFGSSACTNPSHEYSVAIELGELLGYAGIAIVNGGYSGTMEAVSKGARSAGLDNVEGVIVPALFPNRPLIGNDYLTKRTCAVSLMDRLNHLIDASNVYIVLPGSVGTLGEFALAWNHINIDFRVNKTSLKHIICWTRPWKMFLDETVTSLKLGPLDIQNIHFVESPMEAVELARRLLA